MKKYVPVLTIAGSDSSGGAGIQADIKTISALGCYAASAITSITVQNTLGVTAVQAIRPDIVAGQIRAVMDDIKPMAVKIGMVNDAPTIRAIAATLREYDIKHIVVDPVMVATSGSRLMQDDALEVFCKELLPLATLLTPNIPEAEVLATSAPTAPSDSPKGERNVEADMARWAKEILAMMTSCSSIISSDGAAHSPLGESEGAVEPEGAVLIKGGHAEGDKVDRLYIGNTVREYHTADVPTRNTHGTGCTLSSAIAAYLALGCPLDSAVGLAKGFVTEALWAGVGVEIGGGHGPVNHFFNPKKMIIKT